MIKFLLTFILLTFTIATLISFFRSMSRKEKWSTIKLLAYSTGCATIAAVILTVVVLIF